MGVKHGDPLRDATPRNTTDGSRLSDTLIESNIRAAVIELCERASVYQVELDPLTTVSGIFEYDLETPQDTSVAKNFMGYASKVKI